MAPPAAAASDGVHASLLSAGAQLIPEGSRRHAAAATLELQTAAAAKAASAGRSINRITLGNFESLNEVYIGLCATTVMFGVILMVCMPVFDGATVTWLRSMEHLEPAGIKIGIMGPFRRAVLKEYKTPGEAFEALDTGHDGALDLSEYTDGVAQFDDDSWDETTAQRLFDHMDLDQDMELDQAEFLAAFAVPGVRPPDELVSPADAGSTSIEVQGDAMASFKADDKIRLVGAGGAEDVVTVAGFVDGTPGGVVVRPPLEYNYDAGARVEWVESTTTRRTTTTYTTTTKTTTTFTTTTFKAPGIEIKMIIDAGEGADPLGADLEQGQGAVIISGVTGGLIQQWNKDNPTQELKPGDKIVEVNGISNDATKILEELLKNKMLKLVVRRDPAKAPKAAEKVKEVEEATSDAPTPAPPPAQIEPAEEATGDAPTPAPPPAQIEPAEDEGEAEESEGDEKAAEAEVAPDIQSQLVEAAVAGDSELQLKDASSFQKGDVVEVTDGSDSDIVTVLSTGQHDNIMLSDPLEHAYAKDSNVKQLLQGHEVDDLDEAERRRLMEMASSFFI